MTKVGIARRRDPQEGDKSGVKVAIPARKLRDKAPGVGILRKCGKCWNGGFVTFGRFVTFCDSVTFRERPGMTTLGPLFVVT